MTINFYLNNDPKGKSNESAIYCYLRERKKTKSFNIGEKIDPKYWNKEKQEAKKNYTGSPELNSYLASYKEDIRKFVRVLLTENNDISFIEIVNAILDKFKKNEMVYTFFDVFDNFILLRQNDVSLGTIKKYRTLYNHLKNYEVATSGRLSLSNIDLLFYDKFVNYLLTEKQMSNNTVSKMIDILKTFLRWATERNINTNLEYLKFKSKTNQVDSISLSEKELMTLLNLDLGTSPKLSKIRDVFCFSCFTGQRFSDISHLHRDDIKENTWHLRVSKTKDILRIPIIEYANDILKKYIDDDKPLPTISNQKTNKYLKELCEIAGINENIQIVTYKGSHRIETPQPKYQLIGTHTARRTFVTLSLEKGMRPETVMGITGHKDYKTFKKYIKMTDAVKNVEMNRVWSKEPNLKLVSNL